ncbi:putative serf family protein [Fusarium tricinctum]|uniref:Serf family protein n=1 Tax=Fusarium tricinctum TaxID=61284 RepID=A0A8K0RUF3_9HYPO|nr:putative serf family protein [Fusarium tricinctum]
MARGNQREKSRAAALKKEKGMKVGLPLSPRKIGTANNKSGTQMQHEKEANAEKMRQKQAAADARKAAEGKK